MKKSIKGERTSVKSSISGGYIQIHSSFFHPESQKSWESNIKLNHKSQRASEKAEFSLLDYYARIRTLIRKNWSSETWEGNIQFSTISSNKDLKSIVSQDLQPILALSVLSYHLAQPVETCLPAFADCDEASSPTQDSTYFLRINLAIHPFLATK